MERRPEGTSIYKHSATGVKKPCFSAEESLAGILGSPVYMIMEPAMVTNPTIVATSRPLLQVSHARSNPPTLRFTYGCCTSMVV